MRVFIISASDKMETTLAVKETIGEVADFISSSQVAVRKNLSRRRHGKRYRIGPDKVFVEPAVVPKNL